MARARLVRRQEVKVTTIQILRKTRIVQKLLRSQTSQAKNAEENRDQRRRSRSRNPG